ncbi:hypothetical protein PR048_000114 [Dryococelus australis]|uniref:Uncharacterized protein n=1 Tax=Dryococelus australis TaxID=614101 RepID=A0ABQ9IDQ4_9NEOP|nr:hypothetical protein PR048_000114 [Dryococelus australis]
MPISALWELDMLGIRDPELQTTKEERISAVKYHCERRVTRNMDNIDIFNPDIKHYLTHIPVINNQGTTKVRRGFDASSKVFNRPSLSDCLEQGPNFIEAIPHFLIQFQAKNLFFIFLIYLRHTLEVFGVTSSSFMLVAVIEDHLDIVLRDCECGQNAYSKETTTRLQKSFYVNNFVTRDKQDELHKFMEEFTDIFHEAKFKLRGWEHTSPAVDNSAVIPVLGVLWNRGADTISVNAGIAEIWLGYLTKRKILSAAHKQVDRIGFTAPPILIPKLLIQQPSKYNLNWDGPVPGAVEGSFRKYTKLLHWLNKIAISRCITKEDAMLSLHNFWDACNKHASKFILLKQILGLRPLRRQQSRSLSFWLQLSRPRYHKKELIIWGFMCLIFIFGIKKLPNKKSLSHVAGTLNPTDLTSRGWSANVLFRSKWWERSEWLMQSPSDTSNNHCWYYRHFYQYLKILRLLGGFSGSCTISNTLRT